MDQFIPDGGPVPDRRPDPPHCRWCLHARPLTVEGGFCCRECRDLWEQAAALNARIDAADDEIPF